MNKRSRQSRRRIERITLNLTSMIDVTFLLLLYFILTTVLIRPEDRLSPTLQTQTSAEAASDFQPQILEVLSLDGYPSYRLGSRVMQGRDELAEALRGLRHDDGLFVNVHNQIPVGFAVAAIQVARDVGFQQVTYVPQD
ncbi:MAG TPA: biopolymer transporter ExbD [Phycisphaerales bacterium]|nr:biopolymer transporter ExbD [Phycisphaerales bacterium]HRQ74298.1 biopolymer transporter ExbD [Phycisphaerales bacterium]